ncbi:MAG: ATP-binding protein [Alphaproteobacteria bacterium]|nr:ATP-binding protein [Alphaproteobacteria bacterium]
MIEQTVIPPEEVARILALEETHYLDLKGAAIQPAKLTQSISAFANTAGGEIFLGIEEAEILGKKVRTWNGFPDIEAANQHIAAIEAMSPLGSHYRATFLRSPGQHGYVLQLIIFKTKDIICSSDGVPYVRRGAQKQSVKGDDAMRRLRLDKGIVSFEDEAVAADPAIITNSTGVIDFMLNVVPTGEPDTWIAKQNLLVGNKPTVAGILLFADEPQAFLPKRSAIKLYRYKTKNAEGERDTLASDPVTIEGAIYDQVNEAVSRTKQLVEGIKRLGPAGLEDVVYPDETLHEIITNAILHRDYSIPVDIHVRVYDNRIEVESPGRLPGHVTSENILYEQSARNPKIVRLINKFPDPPNKDVGEGLNTAFEAMKKNRLKPPIIEERDHSVIVHIRHASLASPHEVVLGYLENNDEITNMIARDLTGIRSENSMKVVFLALKRRGMIEPVPGKTTGGKAAWRKVREKKPAKLKR